MRPILTRLGWVVPAFGAAAIGASTPPGDGCPSRTKPDGTPPGWVFPVEWRTRYVLMGAAAWLTILETMLAFRRVSWPAALQLAPCAAWVSVATVLKFEIRRLNA